MSRRTKTEQIEGQRQNRFVTSVEELTWPRMCAMTLGLWRISSQHADVSYPSTDLIKTGTGRATRGFTFANGRHFDDIGRWFSSATVVCRYTPWAIKNRATLLWTLTSAFLDGFQHFVYQRNKYSTLPFTYLVVPPSGLLWSSAGAHSEHWWTSAESANRLERTRAADHWQCCRPMERSFGSLCARRGWTFWAHTLKTVHLDSFLQLMGWALKYTDSWFQNVLLCVFLNFHR